MKIHIFPFDKVKKDSKIVLWGMGLVGREYINEVLAINYCHIEYIIDSKPKEKEYKGIAIYHPEEIYKKIDKAVIYVISVADFEAAKTIEKQMLEAGISIDHIIYSDSIYEFTEYKEEIIEEELKIDKIESLQNRCINKGFYISGVPFFVQNKDKKNEYLQMKNKFCKTNIIVNNLDQTRVFFLYQNIENVLSKIKGDVAEVGVYQGATAEILKRFCLKYKRDLYLFDTFEGFASTDIVGIDRGKDSYDFKDTSLEFIKKKLGDDKNIHIKKGYFPESIDNQSRDTSYAFVHIDCDLYKPILESLNFFWPRLQNGGMVAVHDYSSGFWKGAYVAVNEFCENNGITKILIPDWSGTVVLVKNL